MAAMTPQDAQRVIASYRGEYKGTRDNVQWYWSAAAKSYLGVVASSEPGKVEVKLLPKESCGC